MLAFSTPVQSARSSSVRAAGRSVVCAASAELSAPSASKQSGEAARLESAQPRRAALSFLSLGLLAASFPRPSLAGVLDDRGYVDQSRNRGKGECALDEEGSDCRMSSLRDAKSLAYDEELKSGTRSGGNRGTLSANGAATSKADTTYVQKTVALQAEVEQLLALDVYDPSRAAAVATLRKNANAWAAEFAPGGSAKKVSGRAFNNALNQLQSHFAFNGLAPIPGNTLSKVVRNLAETKAAMAEGK